MHNMSKMSDYLINKEEALEKMYQLHDCPDLGCKFHGAKNKEILKQYTGLNEWMQS